MVWLRRYPWFRSSRVPDEPSPAPCGPSVANVSGDPPAADELTLGQAGAGATVQIRRICTESEEARRLREVGLIEGKVIHLLFPGDPLICRVGRCRFGLCRRLADAVRVRRVP